MYACSMLIINVNFKIHITARLTYIYIQFRRCMIHKAIKIKYFYMLGNHFLNYDHNFFLQFLIFIISCKFSHHTYTMYIIKNKYNIFNHSQSVYERDCSLLMHNNNKLLFYSNLNVMCLFLCM